jgi:uncharacterized protein (TIGR03382 family)
MITLAAWLGACLFVVSLLPFPAAAVPALPAPAPTGSSTSASASLAWQEQALPAIGAIIEFAVSADFAQGGPLYLLAWDGDFKLWRGQAGTWQIMLSSGSTISTLEHLALSSSGNLAVSGIAGGQPALWVSRAGGAFVLSIPPFIIDLMEYAADGTLMAAGYNGTAGVVSRSPDGGLTFGPVNTTGNVPLYSLALSPDFPLDGRLALGTIDGGIWMSPDRGASFSRAEYPAGGNVSVSFDGTFNGTGQIYAVSDAPNSGFHSLAFPSLAWRRLDTPTVTGTWLMSSVAGSGLGYAVDHRPVNAENGQGGLLRCLGDGSGTKIINAGLPPGATLWQLEKSGGRLWVLDTIQNRLFHFTDRAAAAPELIAPADFALRIGLPAGGGKIGQVTLEWSAVPGADGYLWQLSPEAGFSALPPGLRGNTAAGSAMVSGLEPSTFYFWRVRVESPLAGPWSVVRVMQTAANELGQAVLETPASGSESIALRPAFSWLELAGATRYELQVCSNADFASPQVSRQLTGLSWQATADLATATTYHWRVRASAPVTGPWSDVWLFSTLSNQPGVPRLESPADALTDVQCSPVFAWSALSGITTYEIAISTRSDFAVILSQRSVSYSWWQCNPLLEAGTRYYWRVRAVKSGMAGGWSEIFSFTTAASPTATPPVTGEQTTVTSTPSPSPPTLTYTTVTAVSTPVLSSSAAQTAIPVLPPPGNPAAADNAQTFFILSGAGVAAALLLAVLVMLARRRHP